MIFYAAQIQLINTTLKLIEHLQIHRKYEMM